MENENANATFELQTSHIQEMKMQTLHSNFTHHTYRKEMQTLH